METLFITKHTFAMKLMNIVHLSHLSVKSIPTCRNLWLFIDRRSIDPGDRRSCDVNSKKNDVHRFC